MCNPSQCDGNLKLRPDWRVKVQDFFVNNSAMEFVRTTPDFHVLFTWLQFAPTLHMTTNTTTAPIEVAPVWTCTQMSVY